MKIHEIFYSIQGESTYAGVPCIFIRFSNCSLRCSFCDTKYAWDEGFDIEPHEVIRRIKLVSSNCMNVCITGGEPFEQRDELLKLLVLLDENGYNVCVETNGIHYIGDMPEPFIAILDVKCPSSHSKLPFCKENFKFIDERDNLKFVAYTREDFNFIEEFLIEHQEQLSDTSVPILISPILTESQILNEGRMQTTADEVKRLGNLFSDLDIRMQIQMHKVIWGTMTRGV